MEGVEVQASCWNSDMRPAFWQMAPSLQGMARRGKEGRVCVKREGSRNRVYVRVDGSSVVDRHVAVRRRSTAGSCSDAKRRHGQSHDELLDLHVVSERVEVCCVECVEKGKE